ncbi:hypothetical protein BDZ45DRAFT_746020 [Acephala macrosclerotiorum]|nr:hypothetical protein BDZ45DRAFT_746020 [Acephala macrosclerotiorum]
MTKTTNLEDHLQDVRVHFSPWISDEAAAERGRLQEEKESTEQRLATCIKTLEHIGQLQSNLLEKFHRDIVSMSPKQAIATANTLQKCKDIFTNTTIDPEEIDSRLQALFVRGAGMLGEDATIRTNVFEDRLA